MGSRVNMKEIIISPSIMCCHTTQIERYIKAFEDKNIKTIHFDVMDGHYVNNIMLGTNFYKDLKSMTSIPIDIHLMCFEPEKFLEFLKPRPNDWVSFHPETTNHPHRLLQNIRDLGCKAGIVLNPSTPINFIDEVVDLLDFVLVMAVNPGFAGQKMVDSHLSKLQRINKNLSNRDIDIIIDGNTTQENAKLMIESGATGLVVGTSSLLKSVDVFLDEHDNYLKSLTK